MKSFARITIALAVLLLALPTAGRADGGGSAARWRVMELPGTGSWFEGRMSDQPGSVPGHQRGSALGRGSAFGNGHYSIYLLNLTPGADYTLGLRYPADSRTRLAVTLFDRWPGDPQAKRYQLSTGPVVLTNPDWIEYRWRIGVSGRSQGNLAFAVVQAGPGIAGANGRFRHFMYLTTPAIQPKNLLGSGITYLRGPSDLMLPEQVDTTMYVVEYPFHPGRGGTPYGHERAGNLIRNGDFKRSLDDWKLLSSDKDQGAVGTVAVGRNGLRLAGIEPGKQAGVRQDLRRYVGDAGSVLLSATLLFDQQTSGQKAGGEGAPLLAVSLCYVDVKGGRHCGDAAYRRYFTPAAGRSERDNVVPVGVGRWYSFEDDLMDVSPKPEVIESVNIEGINLPGSEAWVGFISLTAR